MRGSPHPHLCSDEVGYPEPAAAELLGQPLQIALAKPVLPALCSDVISAGRAEGMQCCTIVQHQAGRHSPAAGAREKATRNGVKRKRTFIGMSSETDSR